MGVSCLVWIGLVETGRHGVFEVGGGGEERGEGHTKAEHVEGCLVEEGWIGLDWMEIVGTISVGL